MTKLRNGIYLRAYAQKNPLSEYTEEAFYMFEQMKLSIVDMISKNIVHMGIRLLINGLYQAHFLFHIIPLFKFYF